MKIKKLTQDQLKLQARMNALIFKAQSSQLKPILEPDVKTLIDILSRYETK